MANKKKVEEQKETLFAIYGARISNSGKYANISIVKGSDDAKEFHTIPVKLKGGKVAVKVDEDFVYLKIQRLDKEQDNVDAF